MGLKVQPLSIVTHETKWNSLLNIQVKSIIISTECVEFQRTTIQSCLHGSILDIMDHSLGKGVLMTFLSKMSFLVEIVCMGLEIKMSKFG